MPAYMCLFLSGQEEGQDRQWRAGREAGDLLGHGTHAMLPPVPSHLPHPSPNTGKAVISHELEHNSHSFSSHFQASLYNTFSHSLFSTPSLYSPFPLAPMWHLTAYIPPHPLPWHARGGSIPTTLPFLLASMLNTPHHLSLSLPTTPPLPISQTRLFGSFELLA